jgi:hypothetical protein
MGKYDYPANVESAVAKIKAEIAKIARISKPTTSKVTKKP